jgi:predicted methyltransferase
VGYRALGAGGVDIAEIDLKAALNAVSDVIQNRPRPIREFDQIYMKAGDMVMQSEFVAHWADGKRLAFIGDGDAISVSVAYLLARGIVDYGPSKITVFDFDERIVGAVNRFADRERLDTLEAVLYNCLDEFTGASNYDCFYTNPPWGASNAGASVKVFAQRGMEAIGHSGEGLIVIADDDDLDWPQEVLYQVQGFALEEGFFVRRMAPLLHEYHLDDSPDLRSCNLLIRSRPGNEKTTVSKPISEQDRLGHFYGKGLEPRVRYVRERKRVDYGMANDTEYEFELIGGGDDAD